MNEASQAKHKFSPEEIQRFPDGDQQTPMTKRWFGVHGTHCCARHSCKYGDEDCPVMTGLCDGVRCESCDMDDEEEVRVLRRVWERDYAKGVMGCCVLCGNTGFVQAHSKANSSPADEACGNHKYSYCICPNGRAMRTKMVKTLCKAQSQHAVDPEQGRINRHAMDVFVFTATATSLLKEVMGWHSDDNSTEYNACDQEPCAWCLAAAKVVADLDAKGKA